MTSPTDAPTRTGAARPEHIRLGRTDHLTHGVPDAGSGPAVLVHGTQAMLGPYPVSGTLDPACPTCLARRWQSVRPQILREALETGSRTIAAGDQEWCNPFAEEALAVAQLLIQERAGSISSRYSVLVELDQESLHLGWFPLVPDPECPECADLPDDAPTAWTDLTAIKPGPDDYRSTSLEDYPLETRAFVNPTCGALGPRVVRDVTSTTTSATVGCFTVRSGDYLRETFWGGHGEDFDASVRIGILEGLERAAGMRPRGRRTVVRAAYADIAADALDPRVCGLYSERFHQAHPWVRPFDEDREIAWVWGWSLTQDRAVLVPEVLAYYHIPGQENRFVQESSSGCATGGSLAEATLCGLLEVIERDAFVLGWYAGRALPELDPETVVRQESRATVDRLRMQGYRARLFDARVTFDVPVVIAAAERLDGGLGRLCFGAGASLDPEAAIAGALCEIATDAPNARMRTTNHRERLELMVEDHDRVLALHDHPLLHGLPRMAAHSDFLLRADGPLLDVADRFSRQRPRPRPSDDDLGQDLSQLVQQVAAAGFDVVAVDQTMATQRSLGLHTANVVVPGLLPVDFGWMRQRAVRMPRMLTARHHAGLDPEPLRSSDLTPAPHPLP